MKASDHAASPAPTDSDVAADRNDVGQRRLQTFTDAIPICMAIVGVDERFLFANRAYAQAWAKPLDEIIGRHVSEVVSDEAFQVIRPKLRQAIAGQTVRYDITLHPTGSDDVVHESVLYQPQFRDDGSVEAVHVVITDQTDVKRTEMRLKQMLHTIQESVAMRDRAEAKLRRSETRLQFINQLQSLLDQHFSDDAIAAAACPRIVEHFGLSRCAMVEFSGPDTIDVFHECLGQNLPATMRRVTMGRHAAGSFLKPHEIDQLRCGRPIVIDDTRQPPRTPAESENYAKYGSIACATIPHLVDGRLKYMLAVCQATPHAWDDDEIGLLQEITSLIYLRLERSRATRQLAEAKSLFDSIMAAHRVGSWTFDLQTGRMMSDDSLKLMFGFPLDQDISYEAFVGRVVASDRQRVARSVSQLLNVGGVFNEDYGVQLPDGQIRFYQGRGSVVVRGNGIRTCSGVVLDITELRTAQSALAESEQRFRRLANAAPAMLWVTDTDHHCSFLSQSWCDFTGQAAADGYGLGWIDAVHPDDREEVKQTFLKAAAGREPFEIDFRLRTASGDHRWVIDSGRPRFDDHGRFEGYVGSVIDAHQRHESQAAISISEERLRAAAAAAGFGMLHADLQAGVVTYSDEMKNLLRLPDNADRVHKPGAIPDWIHHADRQACGRFYHQLLSLPEGESRSIDHRVVRPDGQMRWVRLQAKPVYTGKGPSRKVTQLIGTIVDITGQREFEESLQTARAQAVAASEAKSQFLANMSHEIRTPMTAILGYAELLGDHVSGGEAIGHLQTIRRNGGYLLEIINDILDLSKIEAGKFELDRRRFDVMRVVQDVRGIMEVRARENNLELDVVYQGMLPSLIESDPKRLKQILINLVGNAIKFTRRGGVKVTVSHQRDVDDQGSIDDRIRFSIADTGIGMSDEQRDRLFEPFVQGDSSVSRHFGGTGLGLAISRRLVVMLGGDIDVRSTLGRGSTFAFSIAAGHVVGGRLIDPHAIFSSVSVEPAKPTSVPRLRCNVLVVDDRRDIRLLSRRILSRAGAEVEECEDGQLAVDHVRDAIARSAPPDLVLLDMQMPTLDGYQTAATLRRLGFTGPIIALTADAMQGDMTKCIAAGCNDYLSKPIDGNRLIEMVSLMTTPAGHRSD